MRMALGEASIVASEAAADQFEAHQHAAALSGLCPGAAAGCST